MDSKQKFIKDKTMEEAQKGSKKKRILALYTNDVSMTAKDLSFQAGSSLKFAQDILNEYHVGLVEYFDFGIAPSTSAANTFFIFSDNGTEKKLFKEGNSVSSNSPLTKLEILYIKINLGCSVTSRSIN